MTETDRPAVVSPPPAVLPRAGRGRSLASWVVGVSLFALLPLIVFSAYSVYRAIADQQAQAMAATLRRTTDTAVAIGHQFQGVLWTLRTMGQAESARSGDMAGLFAMAVRVAEGDPRIDSISLMDSEGRQPFNTQRPFGTALPMSAPAIVELHRPVFEKRVSGVSPLVTGTVSGQRVVGVALPMGFGADRVYAARATIAARTLDAWLNEQPWPEDWTAALIDQRQVIVARSREAARFVGQRATDTLVDGMKRGQPMFEATTKDGMKVLTTIAPVPGTNWHVVVGRPADALARQVRESMTTILVAGVLCSLLAIAGALYLARRLGRQLLGVVDAHVRGEESAFGGRRIREVSELAEALDRAREAEARALHELQRAREQTLAQLKERSDMLDVLAHEVRQPLNNASAALQAATVELSRDGKLTAAEPMRRAELVLNEVQQSIGNTLAVASLLMGGGRIEGVDTDIDALIEVAIADMPPSEAHRVRIERATPTRTASMDPGLMRLALRNLLANALRCSPPGSEVVVRVADSDDPLAILLDVEDHGPGIPADRLPDFSASEPPRLQRDARGRRRGLGLHIVHRVMELHGGRLQVLRAGPDGTTMRLVITQFAEA